MSKAQILLLFLFFIFSIDDKDGTHFNGFNTSMSESSERNMCYCTEPLVGGFTRKAGIFLSHLQLAGLKEKRTQTHCTTQWRGCRFRSCLLMFEAALNKFARCCLDGVNKRKHSHPVISSSTEVAQIFYS